MANVTTDKSDYKPGDKVQITANDFTSGSQIQFQILNLGSDGIEGTTDDFYYTPWVVTDDSSEDKHNLSGTIGTTWTVPGTALDSVLILSAVEDTNDDGVFGNTGDITATTKFTDAKPTGNVSSSANLDQWATGQEPDAMSDDDKWINGNLNFNQAHYSEDFYIPYRDVLTDLAADTTYIFTIQWDVTKSGKHALDYVGTFDRRYDSSAADHTVGETRPDPTRDVPNLNALDPDDFSDTLAIPIDPDVITHTLTHDQESGHFTLYGDAAFIGYALAGGDETWGTSDDVGFLVGADGIVDSADDAIVTAGGDNIIGTADDVDASGTYNWDDVYVYTAGSDAITDPSGSATRQISVLLEYSGDGANDSAVLSWGGHIAASLDWGEGTSARDIPGSPYHTAVSTAIGIHHNETDTVNNLAGNQDRSLASKAIIDVVPPDFAEIPVFMDDDALTDGNPGGIGDDWPGGDTVNAGSPGAPESLNIDFGEVGPAVTDPVIFITPQLPASGGFSYEISLDKLTLTIKQTVDGTTNDVIIATLTPDADGDGINGDYGYYVTQPHVISHPDGLDENNVEFLASIRVTKDNGLFTDGGLRINVDDDTPDPVLNTDDNQLGEATTYDGNTSAANGNFQGGNDAAAAGTDTTTATLNAAALGVFTTTPDYGADDDGSTEVTGYQLNLTANVGDQVNGNWTSEETAVMWVENMANESYSGFAGATEVFRVEVNTVTGLITFTQYEELDHMVAEGAANYSDDYLALADGQIAVQQNVRVTDDDNDYKDIFAAIDLGGNYRIGDDGPDPSLSTSDETLGQATTYDGNTSAANGNFQGGNDAAAAGTDTTTATLNAAALGVFTTTPDYGADDDGSTEVTGYQLNLTANVGDQVNGNWTSEETAVMWVENMANESYSGFAGATEVFRVEVNTVTGLITFTQYEELDHMVAEGAANYSDDYLALADGQIAVQQNVRVTDDDNDYKDIFAAIDLGGNYRIGDDGPDPSLSTSDETLGQATTYDGNTSAANGNFQGGNDAAAAGTDTTTATLNAAALGVFTTTTDYGADDDGSTEVTGYQLNLTANVGDQVNGNWTSEETAVMWVENMANESYSGFAGATEVFRVEVNTVTGLITFTQYEELDHMVAEGAANYSDDYLALADGQIEVQQNVRVTDDDNDYKDIFAAIDLGGNYRIGDDGPDPSLSTSDETLGQATTYDGNTSAANGNFQGGNDAAAAGTDTTTATLNAAALGVFTTTPDYGADDDGSTEVTGYQLNLTANVGDQVNGNWTSEETAVMWVENTANESYSGFAGATEVFRVEVNTVTGLITFTQYEELDHMVAEGAANYSDDYLALADGQIEVQQNVRVTDDDNDYKDIFAAIDLGGNYRIGDDGPDPSLSTSDETLGQATTYDGNTSAANGNFQGGNDAAAAGTDTTTATLNAAALGVFTTTPDYGADDDGSTEVTGYQLNLTANVGDQVNGNWTSEETAVMWVENTANESYSGFAGATEVFRVEVNTVTGLITFTQYEELDHMVAEGAANYSDDYLALADGQIAVQQNVRVTDDDNDYKDIFAAIDLGGNYRIGDDGPDPSLSTSDETLGQATTYDGNTSAANGNFQGGNDAAAAGTDTTTATLNAAALGVFTTTPDYGADDDGSTEVTGYQLNLTANVGDQVNGNWTSEETAVMWVENTANESYSGFAGATEVFRVEVNTVTGLITFTQYEELDHMVAEGAANYSDDYLALADGQIAVQQNVRVTDDDNDYKDIFAAIDLGGNYRIGDDGPNIEIAPQQDTDPTLGETLWTFSGAFAYSVGADQHAPTYSASDSDFAGLSLSGTANDEPIDSPVVTWNSEDDNSATFDVSFNYDQDRDPVTAAVPVTGTLVFDKVNDTYTFEMDALEVSLDVTLGEGTGYETYDVGGTTPSNGPSPVATGQLGEGFFIQITGFESPLSAGGDTAVSPGELVSGDQAPVTLSSTALGVSGNTIQSGEAANVNFFQTDPKGNLGAMDFSLVTDFFIKFDGYETETDDLILVLNLVNADDPTTDFTTLAMYVDQYDVYEHDTDNTDIVGTKYEPIVDALDNNDALLVVESNDYNLSGSDNWLLKGLQILSNDAGLTGDAINLNRDVGDDGGSSYAPTNPINGLVGPGNTIEEDSSTNPLKIIDAGFTSVSTVPPTLNLELTFYNVDADADTTAVQTIDFENPVVADLVGSTSLLATDIVL